MPRGRRVNSNGERSKQLLQEKAIELFSSNGFHSTKISDIVKASNVTQPTFYLYFESKEAIYNDLIKQFQQDFQKIINQVCANVTKFDEYNDIKLLLITLFDYYIEKDKLTNIAFDHKDTAQIVNDTLKDFLMDKSVFEGNKEIFVESLLGAIGRLTVTTLLTKKRTSEQLVNELMDIYFSKTEHLV